MPVPPDRDGRIAARKIISSCPDDYKFCHLFTQPGDVSSICSPPFFYECKLIQPPAALQKYIRAKVQLTCLLGSSTYICGNRVYVYNTSVIR
jgi:hypothetical protein